MDNTTAGTRLENPSKRANWLSTITLWYSIPTFVLGYRRQINIDTLYEALPAHKSSYLGDIIESKWRKELESASISKRKPSIQRVLIQMFGLVYFCHGLLIALVELFVKIIQPLALGKFIAYYTPNQTEITLTDVYIYGGIITLCSLLGAFLKHSNFVGMGVLGMKAQIACSSLIYRKTLRLNKAFIENIGGAQILNLLSNHVIRFDNFAVYANNIWINPIQTVIIAYFMYQQVGVSSVIGVVTLALIMPLMLCLGRQYSIHRSNTNEKTDSRIGLMNELINGIEAIKMFTWEKLFTNLVEDARRKEIKSTAKASYTNGMIAALNLCLNHVALYFTILTYTLLYHEISAQQVFVLISFFNILKLTLTISFGFGMSSIVALKVSLKRINDFMVLEENPELYSSDLVEYCYDHSVTLNTVTVKWLSSSTENTLNNINLKVNQGDLVAIVGSVGSGKSSLLYTILKELPILSGDVTVNGIISYASQEPWIFPTSVRQNILFGHPMDKSRYKKVIKYCGLKRDISVFPYGDKTIIGERGITLSGGQRARINLARAVYKTADIYLLDDPLSAVDTRVGKQLFEDCICNFLKSKTVILVTHQLQYLKDVDNIVVLEDGTIKKVGSFLALQESSQEFGTLLKEAEEQTTNVDDAIEKKNESRLAIKSVSSIDDGSVEEPKVTVEQSGSGLISFSLYKMYFTSGSNCCLLSYVAFLFVAAAVMPSLCMYYLTHWVNTLQEEPQDIPNQSSDNYNYVNNLSIYSALIVVTIIVAILRSCGFYKICMRSSIKLHKNLFKSIISAPMRFFNVNTSGRILNRFSKDVCAIDELLPENMLFFLDIALVVISSIVMVSIINPWLIIPSVIFCIITHYVRIIYLVTSISIKRMDAVTKSPVFTHLNVSIQGLSTIRAFDVQETLKDEFDNYQDLHSSTLYGFIVTERALGFVIDMLCVIYIGIVTMSFPVLGSEKFGGNVGLAVSLVVALTNSLQFCVRQSTQMENQMTAVERVLEYTDIEREPAQESEPNKKPSDLWPEKGKIKFTNVQLRYSPDEPIILKQINFTIRPLQKIGIVGRTGAGKSSLIVALFRLATTSGSIIIDDVLTHKIGLRDLRSKISIIPQQPVFLSGSLRRNLDPLDDYQDEVLWKALEDVELKDVIAVLPEGLQTPVLNGGSNFSVGQRQLICLARAIIRNNRILVLDEATANIDLQTDVLIQKTIKRKFSLCTVLTIAHRLNTVMDSDKIMVLHAGKLVEFDHPYRLLQITDGFFYSMVQQTGEETAKMLLSLAEKNYGQFHHEEDLIKL